MSASNHKGKSFQNAYFVRNAQTFLNYITPYKKKFGNKIVAYRTHIVYIQLFDMSLGTFCTEFKKKIDKRYTASSLLLVHLIVLMNVPTFSTFLKKPF